MAKQRVLKDEEGSYEWVGGVTEHEANFMPAVSSGKKKLDAGFDVIYDYQLLPEIVTRHRQAFNEALSKEIPDADLQKIDGGLKAYSRSSSTDSNKLHLLKASILQAEGEDILTRLYDFADEDIQQMMPQSYFEDINKLLSIDRNSLISAESIKAYRKHAILFTLSALKEFHQKKDDDSDFEDFEVHRGQGNYSYYETLITENRPDGLSVFTSIGTEGVPFFERQLFNSYSINRRVAEHFMVMGNNARKYIIDTYLFHVLQNLFSSFVVCKHIDTEQYELLCLPNVNSLFIKERLSNDIVSEFTLSEEPSPKYPDPTWNDIESIQDNTDVEE